MTETREPLNLLGPRIAVPRRRRRGWSEEDERQAREMADRLPERLYRYVRLRGDEARPSDELRRRFASVVRDSTLHFSSYPSFNDPFDGTFRLSFEGDEETIRTHWEEVGAELLPPETRTAWVEKTIHTMLNMTPELERELTRRQREQLSTYGVCCFTGRRDDLLAWAHYAHGHTGICFSFHPRALFDSIARAPSMLLKVQYAKTYPVVPVYQPKMFQGMLSMLATKGEEWRHEQEWRFVREEQGSVPFPPGALDAVILGARIPEEDERFVRGTAEGNVRVLKAELLKREYGLVIG